MVTHTRCYTLFYEPVYGTSLHVPTEVSICDTTGVHDVLLLMSITVDTQMVHESDTLKYRVVPPEVVLRYSV